MFYKEKDIKEELICPKCSSMFTDPRFLPCGHTLCNVCIKESTTDKVIKCPSCDTNHHAKDEPEFSPNIMAQMLVQKQPKKIYQGHFIEKLKEALVKLDEKINELESEIKK